tara:strand:+ start:812 stop:1654 length:843 start_codon:yes stop_codon:yes gene_type:complete
MPKSPNEFLPEVELAPPPPEVEYQPSDPNAPQEYDLKKKLDTDVIFKKKLTRMALDVKELSPDADPEKKVSTEIKTAENIAGDKNLTSSDFNEMKQPAPKKKRQMSQKQLDALARGRATSLEKRRAKKQAKAQPQEPSVQEDYVEVEEPDDCDIVGKPARVKMKVDTRHMPEATGGSSGATEQNVSWEDEHKKQRNPDNKKNSNGEPYNLARSNKAVSKEEIEGIMMGAIGKYDAQRKAEKKIKKEKQAKEVSDQRITRQINRAMDPTNPDYFSDCFTFS